MNEERVVKILCWLERFGVVFTLYQFFVVKDYSVGTIIALLTIIFTCLNYILKNSLSIRTWVKENNPFQNKNGTLQILFNRCAIIYISVIALIFIFCMITDSIILGIFNLLGVPIIFMICTIYICIIDSDKFQKYKKLYYYIQLVPYIIFALITLVTSVSRVSDLGAIVFMVLFLYGIIYFISRVSFSIFNKVINED